MLYNDDEIIVCPECEQDDGPEPRATFADGSHAHCPDCGRVFEAETYPYCRACRVRWD